jgi:hypothetical protein
VLFYVAWNAHLPPDNVQAIRSYLGIQAGWQQTTPSSGIVSTEMERFGSAAAPGSDHDELIELALRQLQREADDDAREF